MLQAAGETKAFVVTTARMAAIATDERLSAKHLNPEELLQLAALVTAQHRSQQLQAGHARNRVNLLPPPGRAPYGYRRGRYRYALDKAASPRCQSLF
jgi:hypothetical protein